MPTTFRALPGVNRRGECRPSGPRRDVEHAIAGIHLGEGDESRGPFPEEP